MRDTIDTHEQEEAKEILKNLEEISREITKTLEKEKQELEKVSDQ